MIMLLSLRMITPPQESCRLFCELLFLPSCTDTFVPCTDYCLSTLSTRTPGSLDLYYAVLISLLDPPARMANQKALGVPGFSSNSTWITLSDSKPLPSGAALQLALSSIICSAVAPEVKLNLQTLNLRCQEILSNGVSVKNIDFSNLN